MSKVEKTICESFVSSARVSSRENSNSRLHEGEINDRLSKIYNIQNR